MVEPWRTARALSGSVSRPGCVSSCEGTDTERAGRSEPPMLRHPDFYPEEGTCWCQKKSVSSKWQDAALWWERARPRRMEPHLRCSDRGTVPAGGNHTPVTPLPRESTQDGWEGAERASARALPPCHPCSMGFTAVLGRASIAYLLLLELRLSFGCQWVT